MSLYTHTTYLQFRNLILGRLGDSIFVTDSEAKRYALESLRTWNALAQFNRDRGNFILSAGTAFYDIPSLLDGNASMTKILNYNIKDQDLFTDLKFSLLEDASTTNSWTGTSQFNLQDCQDALEKSRNEFLLRTNLIQTASSINLSPAPSGRISLSDSIIDVQRVSLLSEISGSTYLPLMRDDEFNATSFNQSWNLTPATTYAYSIIMTPKVSLQLIPISQVGGTLSLITLNTGSNLDLASSTGILMSIPDDWAWAIKFKALFYLLSSDGEATDQFRAEYCNQRFEEAILAAKLSSTVQAAYINDQSLMPTTIADMDRFSPSWQSLLGTPTKLALAGRNLLALSPVPDQLYSITLDVVRNHPIPTLDGDFIQVGREHLNAIVDYAVHLAMFKQGGAEFAATISLKDNLFQLAMENNLRLKAQAGNLERLVGKTKKQEVEVPMYSRGALTGT